jgi:autotransporter translocation and assembly factor TamB
VDSAADKNGMKKYFKRRHHKKEESGHLRPGLSRESWRRRWLRVVCNFGIILIGVSVLLAVLPSIPPFKGIILSFVDRRISSMLSCKANIGAITLDIWNGVVSRNIDLSDSKIQNEPLHVKRIAIKINIMALLRGRFELHSIEFSGFRGEFKKTDRGLFLGPIDIGRMTETSPVNKRETAYPSHPWVRTIGAERCTVSYIDSVAELAVSGRIISARVEFIRTDSMSFIVRADAGKISSPRWKGGVRSIDVQGTIGSEYVQFSKAEVLGDSILLQLNGTIPFSTEKAWCLTAKVEAFIDGFAQFSKNVSLLKPVGKVKAKAVMTGTFKRPILDLSLTGYGLRTKFVKTDSIFLKTHYSDDRLIGQARLWSPTGTADASVRVKVAHLFSSPAVGSYTLTASAQNVNMRHLITASQKRDYQPAFLANAGLFAAGSGLQRLPDTLSAEIRKLTDTTEANPINITLRMAANKWDLTATMKPDCEVKGKGLYTNRGAIDGSFHIQADSIDRIVSIFTTETVRGSMTADARMSGTLGNPAISVTVQSSHLLWRDIQISRLWGRFALRDRVLFIDSSSISANGSITKSLRGLVPGEFSGEVWAKAGVSGRFDSLSIGGDLQTGPCSYGRYRADTVFAHFRYVDQSLRWRSLTIKRGKTEISSDGNVSWANRIVTVHAESKWSLDKKSAGSFSAEARLNQHSSEASGTAVDLDPMVLTPWFPQAKRFQGSLNAHCVLAGESENPKLSLDLSLDHPLSSGLVLTATGEMEFTDGIATATLNAVQKGSDKPIRVTAHLPVSWHKLSRGIDAFRDGSVITLSGDSVSYGGMVNLFAPSVQSFGIISLHGRLIKANDEWGISCGATIVNQSLTIKRDRMKAGRAVIDLQFDGPLKRPVARFTLNGDSVRYKGGLINSYSGRGSIVNDVLILDTLHLTSHGGGADMNAMVPVTRKNGFSIDKNSRLTATLTAMPFSIVQPLMPDPVMIQKGSISGSVDIKTTDEGIRQAKGTLSLRNGECDLYECDQPLDHLSLDVDFQDDLIILRRLRADMGGGHITGTGQAVLDAKGVSHAQSVIQLSDVRLGGCTDNLDLGIQTGDIHLTMDSLITLKMNLLLANTRFSQDFSIIDISERINRKAPQTRRPPNPLFKKVVMRIAVNLNSNLTLDSNLGHMLLDGTVTIAGRPDRPSIAGQFQVLNGFVYYLDRKFTITQGTIRQYDPQRINPSLDVTAVSGVSWVPPQGGQEDYEITLLIKGDLSGPAVTLSAVPSLPQQQIISLMTFGTIQMGSGTDLGPRTGSLISQQLSGFGSRKLARFLNVESVGIYGNIFDPTSDEMKLAITKQVSSRVMMTYRTGLSTLSQQTILVSYRLLPFLYFEAETDQQAQGGVDLKFRYSH